LKRRRATGSFGDVVTADVLAPPTFLAAGLLAVAGAIKVARPRAAEQFLIDLGLGGGARAAQTIGAGEIAVAGWAFVAPAHGGAYVLAWTYAAFAGSLAYVLVAHPDAGSCGCAGSKTVPPSALHICLDVLAGCAALGYAITHAPGAATWIASLGVGAFPVVGAMLFAAWLVTVAVAEAPGAWRAWSAATVAPHAHEPHDHPRADDALALAGIGPGHPSLWPATAMPVEDRTA
jgi:hypothetical protein